MEKLVVTFSFSSIFFWRARILDKVCGFFISPSTRTLMSTVPAIFSSIKSMVSRISVPGLKNLLIFTSTTTLEIPNNPMRTIMAPTEKTYFGCVSTIFPNLLITFSNILSSVIALDFKFHFFRLITAGSINELKNQAQAIPMPIVIPYPKRGSIGDNVIVAKAAMVVTLVSNIGTRSESIVVPSAKRTSCLARNSLKNFETTCTPSELAIVKRMMGIEVLARVNRNRSEPVNL